MAPPRVDAEAALARALGWLGVGGQPPARRLLGLVGPPGVGKSTFATWLAAALTERTAAAEGDAPAVLPMDGFHLATSELTRLGRAERKGAPDTFDAAGLVAALQRIRRGDAVLVPRFDRTIEEPIAGALHIAERSSLVVVEGNYLLLDVEPWVGLAALLDETWYLHVDDVRRRARLVDRHVRYGRSRSEADAWVAAVDEPNAELIAACRPRADLVVDLSGWESDR